MLFVGIDAGGTKTRVRLCDASGRLVGEGLAGPGNWHVEGEVGFLGAVREAYAAALACLGDRPGNRTGEGEPAVRRVVAGVAGVGRREEERAVLAALAGVFPGAALEVHNDAFVALAAGTLGEPGAVVVAGTGSMALALGPGGELVRAGGWGYLLGDEGSGFYIGLEGIKAALRDHDGTGPGTSLKERLLEELDFGSPDEFVAFAYRGKLPREKIASLARAVLEEARAGDSVAKEIANAAVAHLVRMCATVIRKARFKSTVPVVTAGGLFADRRFRRTFVERVKAHLPTAQPARAVIDPAAGACALGLKRENLLGDKAKKLLLESFRQRELKGAG